MDTTKWTKQIDEVTEAFENEFGKLPFDIIFSKPAADVWSVGENISHIIRINESYYPILDALQQGIYNPAWTSKIGFLVRFFGEQILKSVNPDRTRKMKTFPLWEPDVSEQDAEIFTRFRQHQEELKRRIQACSVFLDEGAIIHSPANKFLVYKLETAFDIIVTHEKRHYEQSAETLHKLKGNVSW